MRANQTTKQAENHKPTYMETEKFATPVAMECENEECGQAAELILRELGYVSELDTEEYNHTGFYAKYRFIATNYNGVHNHLNGYGFRTGALKDGRILIPYNLPLLKALAAMRSEGWGKGELVKLPSDPNDIGVICEVKAQEVHVNRFRFPSSMIFAWATKSLTKLTAAEIIQHFADEVLPEKWAVERTKENAGVVNAWANQGLHKTFTHIGGRGWLHSEPVDPDNPAPNILGSGRMARGFTPISFETFERLVLKKQPLQVGDTVPGTQGTVVESNGETCRVEYPNGDSALLYAHPLKGVNETLRPAYGGQIADFPPEIVEAMLNEQERQGNKRDVTVFEKSKSANASVGGMTWENCEDDLNWNDIILRNEFDHFFARYPKQRQPVGLVMNETVRDLLSRQIESLKQATGIFSDLLREANAEFAAAQVKQQDVASQYNEHRRKLEELEAFMKQFQQG